MPVTVWRNAFLAINGTDLSSNVTSLAINHASEMLDATAMGDTTKRNKGGLLTEEIDVEFNQNFAAGQVDATLYGLVGTTVCAEIRPDNSCSTATNPSFSGIFSVESYNPVGGKVGTLLQAPLRMRAFTSMSRASSS